MNSTYIRKLAEEMTRAGFDAMMIAPGEELAFLLGVSPMLCERFQGFFVKADGSMFYICNLLYAEELGAVLPREVPVYPWFDGENMTEIVSRVLSLNGLTDAVIGVDQTARAFNILEIMEKVPVTFKNGKALLEEIRIRKTPEELEALRDSAKIVDQVFEDVLPLIKPGVTEREIGQFLLKRMKELGGSSPECIAAFGANASFPHYSSDTAVLKEKDIVLMDYGCTLRGMYSDMTRTVFVGEPTEKEREIYDLVLRANLEAEAQVCKGAWIPDIDRTARDVLDEKGYAHTLISRLGHGIGYTIHEAPEIRQSNERSLESGMAFSIEPGIYIPGEIGVRIEDIVIINEEGKREVLNHADKKLIVL